MNRYQLAKIVGWAGTLRTRKRMQKVVYLLQAAGCPLEADYFLHHYGPYSHDVARLSDEMVGVNLLEEQSNSSSVGQQYSYRLGARARASIAEFEKTQEGRDWSDQMAAFETKAQRLLTADLKALEIASTVVYFLRQGNDWSAAVDKACEFKGLTKGSQAVKGAEALARQIVV
jgi:uncharacterized protein YwgA